MIVQDVTAKNAGGVGAGGVETVQNRPDQSAGFSRQFHAKIAHGEQVIAATRQAQVGPSEDEVNSFGQAGLTDSGRIRLEMVHLEMNFHAKVSTPSPQSVGDFLTSRTDSLLSAFSERFHSMIDGFGLPERTGEIFTNFQQATQELTVQPTSEPQWINSFFTEMREAANSMFAKLQDFSPADSFAQPDRSSLSDQRFGFLYQEVRVISVQYEYGGQTEGALGRDNQQFAHLLDNLQGWFNGQLDTMQSTVEAMMGTGREKENTMQGHSFAAMGMLYAGKLPTDSVEEQQPGAAHTSENIS